MFCTSRIKSQPLKALAMSVGSVAARNPNAGHGPTAPPTGNDLAIRRLRRVPASGNHEVRLESKG